MIALTQHAAVVLTLVPAVGIVMVRLGLHEKRLRARWEHRCVSCGTIVQSRVCPRCGPERRPRR